MLERDGEIYFGEPALDLNDLLQRDEQGRAWLTYCKAQKLIPASADIYFLSVMAVV